MANSDAAYLEALKTARDSVVAQIASGNLTVSYSVNGKSVTKEAPTVALETLGREIARVEALANRKASTPFRLAKLNRPRGLG